MRVTGNRGGGGLCMGIAFRDHWRVGINKKCHALNHKPSQVTGMLIATVPLCIYTIGYLWRILGLGDMKVIFCFFWGGVASQN